jgi:hypothetical protein
MDIFADIFPSQKNEETIPDSDIFNTAAPIEESQNPFLQFLEKPGEKQESAPPPKRITKKLVLNRPTPTLNPQETPSSVSSKDQFDDHLNTEPNPHEFNNTLLNQEDKSESIIAPTSIQSIEDGKYQQTLNCNYAVYSY